MAISVQCTSLPIMRRAIVVILMLTCTACAPSAQVNPPMWALVKAPSLPYFPQGSWGTPKSQWTTVSTYPSEAECRTALDKLHATEGARPLDCISTQSRDYQSAQRVSPIQ
jgi:hypothetical protein